MAARNANAITKIAAVAIPMARLPGCPSSDQLIDPRQQRIDKGTMSQRAVHANTVEPRVASLATTGNARIHATHTSPNSARKWVRKNRGLTSLGESKSRAAIMPRASRRQKVASILLLYRDP